MHGRFRHKLGIVLIVASCIMWAAVFLVPIVPWSGTSSLTTVIAQKAVLTTGLIVTSEVIFWLGILLSGREFARRYLQKLNPYYWWQKFTKR